MFLNFLVIFQVLWIFSKGQEFDNFADIAITDQCPFQSNQFTCNANTRYSKLDGSCNNLERPWLGKAFIPFKRYLRPVYDDQTNSPRLRSRSGNFLPNPRTLSLLFSMDRSSYEVLYTHLLPIFGQFMAHDLTNSPPSQDSSGNSLNCDCSGSNSECISISMPSNENIMRMSCMRLARTAPANFFINCGFIKREQLNTMTSFLDGSQIYGSNDERSNSLRLFQSGLLKTSQGTTNRPFLPLSQVQCGDGNIMTFCFMAGEDRTSENLGLVAVQTLFMREHNRIATELSRINPHWNDQTLFMETRKLIIGMYQHIIYREWLPTIIGQNYALKADLLPSPYSGFSNKYNPNVNPTIANEFATAAFRFGHTLVRNNFGRYGGNGYVIAASLNISEIIFKNIQAYNTMTGGIESIFLGLLNEPAAKYDSNLADTLQNHLFEFKLPDGSVQALDLLAANINRGRDHGIAPYNQYRQKCGLPFAYSFQDFADVMSWENVQKLANVYQDVNDVDLYLAGLFENPVFGGVVGPTFACLIANQFKDLKVGDRYFYENGPSKSAFTVDQLNEIKKLSLSRLICNDFDIDQIQKNAFMINSQKISCSQIPSLDLSKWKAY